MYAVTAGKSRRLMEKPDGAEYTAKARRAATAIDELIFSAHSSRALYCRIHSRCRISLSRVLYLPFEYGHIGDTRF